MKYNYEDINDQYEDVVFDLKKFQKPSSTDTQVVSTLDKDNHNLEKTVVLALIKGEISDNEISKRKNLSNNSIKSFCRVGYDKANRFLEKLAEYGIVGKQDVEKQGRPVDSNKAAEFLRERGYTIKRIETILNELAETWNEKGVSLITPNNIKNTLNQLLPYFNDSEDKPILSDQTKSEDIGDKKETENVKDTKSSSNVNNLNQHSNAAENKEYIQSSKKNEYYPENHSNSNRNNIGNKNQPNNKKNHNHKGNYGNKRNHNNKKNRDY